MYHAVLLVVALLPVVLLAKRLAKVIDYGIEKLHAPTTLGGIVIAILILSPEGLTAFQAARQNHLQRSVNVSLGSALSTIGLTIPAMLAISLAIGIPLQLGLAPAEAILLVLTLFIAQMTFSGARDQHSARRRPSRLVCHFHRADFQSVTDRDAPKAWRCGCARSR